MNYVLVIWEDAHAAFGEISTEEARRVVPKVTHTVGHMVAHTDDGITVAVDSYPEGTFGNWHFIPTDMISEVIPLHAGPVLGDEE